MMQAFVIETRTTITPFKDPVGQTLVLDRPLKELQNEILGFLGCNPEYIPGIDKVPPGEQPTLVLNDTLYFSKRLLETFVEKSNQAASIGPFQLWVKKGLFTRLLAVIQEAEEDPEAIGFPLWYFKRSTGQRSSFERILIDVDEDSYEGNFPKHMIKKEGYRFCISSLPIISITHPLHIALANMAANFARLAELKKMSFFRKLITVVRARSINKYRVLRAVSSIHPEAEVHPTAVIEGSVVERGAKIGAYSVIKFSFIGENAFIDDHAGVKFSIVGKNAFIANNCVLFFSVVYPRAFLISGPYQFSLFGYDSALMNAIPADYRLDAEPISVYTPKGFVSTGLKFVGSVIGHRTKIGAGIIISPGQIIPNDLQILPDPARVIRAIPREIPNLSPLFLIGGKLVPANQIPQIKENESS